ncbi:MAG: hypothetical protein EBS53_14780 [Bacteroidetes bacterium]|nr:hypothetical protein [Bacteroidota bacterium]
MVNNPLNTPREFKLTHSFVDTCRGSIKTGLLARPGQTKTGREPTKLSVRGCKISSVIYLFGSRLIKS